MKVIIHIGANPSIIRSRTKLRGMIRKMKEGKVLYKNGDVCDLYQTGTAKDDTDAPPAVFTQLLKLSLCW